MHLLIIGGSHRSNSNSEKVAHLIQEKIQKPNSNITAEVILLSDYPKLLFHYGEDQSESPSQEVAAEKL